MAIIIKQKSVVLVAVFQGGSEGAGLPGMIWNDRSWARCNPPGLARRGQGRTLSKLLGTQGQFQGNTDGGPGGLFCQAASGRIN